MRILGVQIESPHDSGVALLYGDELLFAAGEERYDRVKMSGAFPALSWADCMRVTGTRPEDIDLVVFIGNRPVEALRYLSSYKRKAFEKRREGRTFESEWWSLLVDPLRYSAWRPTRRYLRKHRRLHRELAGYRAEVVCFPHHMAHAVGAYYTTPPGDPVVLVVEGLGDDRTASYSTFENGSLECRVSGRWPDSIGRYYGAVTKLLGFNDQRHGGKITGLSAYGDPTAAYEHVRPLLWNEGTQLRVSSEVFRWTHEWKRLGKKLPPPLDAYAPADIAAAFQRRLEEVVCDWTSSVLKETGRRELVLSGGVFANVKLNQRLHELPEVDRISVHPGMGDVGLAVGAALAGREMLALREGRQVGPIGFDDVYLGPEPTEAEMEAALREAGVPFERPADLEVAVALRLAAGNVVARFAGRMEYGPRALGNRSILYPADDPTVNDWLNRQLNRTEFMPFAPACPAEECERLFEGTRGAERTAEFMTVTFDCTQEMRERGAAAVHVDGTARPQLVTERSNPGFYRILREFGARTGFPVLINTSFNLHEEPIVRTPGEAIEGFLAAKLDALALGPFLATRPGEGLRR